MRWLFVVMVWGLSSSVVWGGEPPAREEARQVMGTVATVQVWAADELVAVAAVDTAFTIFTAVDSLMSTWNGNSPLSRLNRAEPGTWVTVGPEVCEVLVAACRISRLTDGAFDPTVLPLVRAWGFRGGQPTVPDSLTLAQACGRVDVSAVEVASPRARLLRPGMALDLGGIAKGYALDQAAAALVCLGAEGGVLDLGGNLLVFGNGPGTQVGVVDPTAPDSWAATLPVAAGAVATSGQYERFVTINGQVYGHILDPRTGWPVAAGSSATVIAGEALWADAVATAAVVLGGQQGLALLERLPGVEGVMIVGDWLAATSGIQAELAQ